MHADTELNTPGARSQPIWTHTWPPAMAAVPVTLGTKVITASLSLFLPIRQTSTHNSRSSTGDFQREKKLVSNNCTSVPPCISCQKQTLYPQGTSRSLGSTSAIWRHLFCVCFPHMFSAATVQMFTTLFYLFSNKPSFHICLPLLMQSS